ncbi:hypothetical protein Trydic_g17249 [Trypoxylus dichotomus]
MTDSNFVITGEAEGLQPIQLSVKELIAATIDAMSANSDTYKNKDVSGLIPQYQGLVNEDIEKWFERIDMAKRIYRVADDKMLLTIINKLGENGTGLVLFKAGTCPFNIRNVEIENG